jgi:deazaflavin-dependent oxidoreductase (nitroreductase family)
MESSSLVSEIIWRIMRWMNPRLLARFRSGGKPGALVLLLTTTGRVTGRDHVTPLQYEQLDGSYYVGSARGVKADWYCNILTNPEVTVEIAGEVFPAHAQTITDPVEIADFLELRLRRRPRMIKSLLRLEGLPGKFTRAELEEFAGKKAVVVLHPSI